MKYALLLIPIIILSSCNGTLDIFGKKVALVNNRDANGKFIVPTSPVDGQTADSSATLYHFPGGDYGVSLWSGGSVNGAVPQLRK